MNLQSKIICATPNCGKVVHGKGLCNRHYKRSRQVMHSSLDINERFGMKTRRAANGCLEWIGAIGAAGYGMTTYFGKRASVHRLAWELQNGPIPPGMVVCHTCDNRKCVAIEHLFIGTQSDNIRDAWSKGRGRAPWQKT